MTAGATVLVAGSTDVAGPSREYEWLLAGAVVASALHRAPFILPAGLLFADLMIGVVLVLSVGDLVRRLSFDRHYRTVVIGLWLMVLGYMLGMSFGGVSVTSLSILAREALPPVVFLGVVARLTNRRTLSSIPATAMVLMAVVVSALLIADSGADIRGSATFRNPNYAGHYLAVALVCLLIVAWRPAIRVAVAIVLALGILATGSFGAIAAVLAAVAYRLVCVGRSRGVHEQALLRLVAVSALVGVGWFGVVGISDSTFNAGSGLDSTRLDRSSSTRFDLWQRTIDEWSKRPVGIGFARSANGQPIEVVLGFSEPHSNFLSALLNGGVLSAIGLLVISIGVWRLLPPASWSRMLFVAFTVSGIFRQTWNFRHAWLALAIVASVDLLRARRSSPPSVQVAAT